MATALPRSPPPPTLWQTRENPAEVGVAANCRQNCRQGCYSSWGDCWGNLRRAPAGNYCCSQHSPPLSSARRNEAASEATTAGCSWRATSPLLLRCWDGCCCPWRCTGRAVVAAVVDDAFAVAVAGGGSGPGPRRRNRRRKKTLWWHWKAMKSRQRCCCCCCCWLWWEGAAPPLHHECCRTSSRRCSTWRT